MSAAPPAAGRDVVLLHGAEGPATAWLEHPALRQLTEEDPEPTLEAMPCELARGGRVPGMEEAVRRYRVVNDTLFRESERRKGQQRAHKRMAGQAAAADGPHCVPLDSVADLRYPIRPEGY